MSNNAKPEHLRSVLINLSHDEFVPRPVSTTCLEYSMRSVGWVLLLETPETVSPLPRICTKYIEAVEKNASGVVSIDFLIVHRIDTRLKLREVLLRLR